MKYENFINAIVSKFYEDFLKGMKHSFKKNIPFKCIVVNGCHT